MHRDVLKVTLVMLLSAVSARSEVDAVQTIFPQPQQIAARDLSFTLSPDTWIVVPSSASAADLALARFLQGELAERHGVGLTIQRAVAIPRGRPVILMGSRQNPLVREYCLRNRILRARD